MKKFQENCKKILKERGLSQRKLALKMGVSQQSVWIRLNTDSAPSLERFIQICQILEVSSSDLLAI